MSGSHSRASMTETQVERTRLSWGRTALAAGVVVALVVRDGFVDGISPLSLALMALCLAVWLAIAGVAWLRVAAMVNRGAHHASRAPLLLGTLVGVLSLAGLLLVLLRL